MIKTGEVEHYCSDSGKRRSWLGPGRRSGSGETEAVKGPDIGFKRERERERERSHDQIQKL